MGWDCTQLLRIPMSALVRILVITWRSDLNGPLQQPSSRHVALQGTIQHASRKDIR